MNGTHRGSHYLIRPSGVTLSHSSIKHFCKLPHRSRGLEGAISDAGPRVATIQQTYKGPPFLLLTAILEAVEYSCCCYSVWYVKTNVLQFCVYNYIFSSVPVLVLSGLELDKIYWTDTDLAPPARSQAPILTRGREKRKPTRHSSRGHWSGFV